MREHGQMGHHLVVRELVALCALDDAIDGHHFAISLGFKDLDILVR